MSTPKNFWVDPVDAEMLMQRMEIEIEKQRMQNNAYNAKPSGLGQGLVGQAWGGGLNQAVVSPESYVMEQVANTNEAMSRVHDQMQRLQAKVETLTGFYTWMTQMYPDLIAQHKAMCDLYAAANPGEDAGTLTGGMK
tara:strand:+ start:798 stop:1208 length:411 start_codon:yes stop_codon:yes gene_type:complete